ncbi:sphingomyelin phosphodiesterase 4 [Trichonephila clavipes]|nr:sphingomyelin phosphodiesterase 4 [Trichonephila clavipes]
MECRCDVGDCTGADFPCIDEPAIVSISSLTVSAAFRRVLGRPLRGLSSKQPVTSNFEIILATAAFVNGPLPLRIPFELQYVFPTLVENIFGFRTGIDWGLLTLEKDIQIKEFDSFRKLLAPDGPILKIANKFTEEFCPKFEFSIACLPIPSQTILQEGKVPALYVNKLQILNPGIFPSTLQLNAFEFYFFHFTYFIVNPTLKNSLSNVNQQDTLYAHLLEDYLSSFLPTDNRAVPLFQTPSNIQHSPILTSSLSSNYGSAHVSSDHLPTLNTHNTSPGRPDFLSPLKQKPSLLKKGTVLMVASPSSNSSYGFGTSPVESWRSETFILILKEMYLNQNTLDNQKTSYVLIPKTFIPSHYHIWMVRIMVKHLHFFFNSTLSSNQSSGHGQIMIDSLGRLKRDLELEVNEDDIEEFIMGHEDELTTEELQEILNEEHQETQQNVSPSVQEENESGPMLTSAIKDLLKKWEDVRAMVLKWHPNQADVSRVGDLYNNNAIN